MQLYRTINEGCLDIRVIGFCAAGAILGVIALTVVGLAGSHDYSNQILSYYTGASSTFTSEGNRCASSPPLAEQACHSVWESLSVIEERDGEILFDVNTREEKRSFTPVGVSAFLFILFGAYRGSPSNFSIVGLSPKPLHVYGNPGFECFWIPKDGGETLKAVAGKYLPGLEAADQYTATVVHCNFDRDVGTGGTGGSLEIQASMGSQDSTGLQGVRFVALTEHPGEYDASLFHLPFKYDFMYCGSPLYGPISPQRVREWIAYHAMIFGPRSHFILYDAGGFHDDVRKILSPWVKLGRVSIMNYRQEARYDSHYHSQAICLNDCLLQAKRMSEWAFFFDVDEYIYVPPHLTFDKVMKELAERGRRAQQVTFDQRPINLDHCVRRPWNDSDDKYQSEWGIEKLVFQRTQVTERGGWKDHKYAVQTKYMLAAGTHNHEYSSIPEGMGKKDTIAYVSWEDKLHYYHYHNTITIREDLCKEFVDPSIKETTFNNVTHVFDNSMALLAGAVRQFELETVGAQPFIL